MQIKLKFLPLHIFHSSFFSPLQNINHIMINLIRFDLIFIVSLLCTVEFHLDEIA